MRYIVSKWVKGCEMFFDSDGTCQPDHDSAEVLSEDDAHQLSLEIGGQVLASFESSDLTDAASPQASAASS